MRKAFRPIFIFLYYNKRHFARMHYAWMAAKKQHAGIILSDQL